MIIALDIETVGNPDVIGLMPNPKVKTGNLKDPAKIAEKVAEAKRDQVADMALDPLTARIVCFAAVGTDGNSEKQSGHIVGAATDADEIELLQAIMRILGTEEVRLVTWNGVGFDLPMIYKRAMILGVDPADFGAPPLSAWTKRYSTDRHYDLMQIWGGWSTQGYAELDTVAGLVLKERKTEIDVATFAALLATEEGRNKIAAYCLQDTRLTWRLWNRFNGWLFN